MLFDAQVNAGERILKLLVKFTDQYNQQAHTLAADANLAPKLYCVQDVAGMKMVVMEFLEDSRPWPLVKPKNVATIRATLCAELDRFLDLIDNANLVHGDLRRTNVHVMNNDRLCILDFDWAGTHGQDQYTIAANPEECWAAGVQAAQPMLKEHDKFMVEDLVN